MDSDGHSSMCSSEPQYPTSWTATFPSRHDSLPQKTIGPPSTSMSADGVVQNFPIDSAWNFISPGHANTHFPPSRVDTRRTSMHWQNDQNSHSGLSEYGQVDVDPTVPDALGFQRHEATAERGGYHDIQQTSTSFFQSTNPVSHGTFYDSYQSVYIDNYPDFHKMVDPTLLDDRTSPQNIFVDTVQPTISSSDSRDVPSKSTSTRPSRKRPRQNKRTMSSASSSTSSAEAFATNFTHDGMAKAPAASETSKKSFFSGMISTTSKSKACNGRFNKKSTILLAEELQREREHRKTREALDLSIKRLQAAMFKVSDLQEQIQNLQISSQQPTPQYDEAALYKMLQENLRRETNTIRRKPTPQKAQSSQFHHTNETGNSDHTGPSRTAKPRPLSILGSVTSDETAVAQSRSLTSIRKPSSARGRFPISTAPSNTRFGSAVSSRRTSTIGSNQVPSAEVSTALIPGNPTSITSQTRPGSSQSGMVNTSFKKLKHKLSSLSNRAREENIHTAPPGPSQLSPTLPAVEVDVPLGRQMSGILNGGDNRNTGHSVYTVDSGYGPSFECERNLEAPPPDSY
ncbi:hypothetical protein BDZ45DRAFT_477919 [Acephala macrosclerotiorum]|nr:hypothetical protein BDZ45DRAFT_477919 [Acephala macrosclerotiorum]